MERRKVQIVGAAGLILLVFAAGMLIGQMGAPVRAQEGPRVKPAVVGAVTSPLLQYQGRLSDPGTGEAVADGSYTMTLRLYQKASGGSSLWTEVKDVAVQGGLFSTVLGDKKALDQGLFDGRALWLGVKVGSDEEAQPRQQILPVAYALGLLPGAEVQANGGSPALTVGNSGSGLALAADGPAEVDGNLTVGGKLKGGTHEHSAHNNDPSAHHKRYTDSEAISAALSSPEIVTQYEFQDHIWGGMHNGRAIAYGSINSDGSIASSTGNISSVWRNVGKYYEITIDGHDYEWQSYVTIVTPVVGGVPNAWSINNGKLRIGFYPDMTSKGTQADFHFVTFQP